jgi:hypothetical protein
MLNVEFLQNPFVGVELFHADRHTNMTKLIVAFLTFANAPNNT